MKTCSTLNLEQLADEVHEAHLGTLKVQRRRSERLTPNTAIVPSYTTVYGGETVSTLRELAKRSGVPYSTITSRFQRGDRGERLFRASATKHARRVRA